MRAEQLLESSLERSNGVIGLLPVEQQRTLEQAAVPLDIFGPAQRSRTLLQTSTQHDRKLGRGVITD